MLLFFYFWGIFVLDFLSVFALQIKSLYRYLFSLETTLKWLVCIRFWNFQRRVAWQYKYVYIIYVFLLKKNGFVNIKLLFEPNGRLSASFSAACESQKNHESLYAPPNAPPFGAHGQKAFIGVVVFSWSPPSGSPAGLCVGVRLCAAAYDANISLCCVRAFSWGLQLCQEKWWIISFSGRWWEEEEEGRRTEGGQSQKGWQNLQRFTYLYLFNTESLKKGTETWWDPWENK